MRADTVRKEANLDPSFPKGKPRERDCVFFYIST
jgi:hypothetical protein